MQALDVAPELLAQAEEMLGNTDVTNGLLNNSKGSYDTQGAAVTLSAGHIFSLTDSVRFDLRGGLGRRLAAGAATLTLLDLPETHRQDFGAADNDHAHDDPAHGGHADLDPHAWLDPKNAEVWLDAIAKALAAADPEHAATYAANAAAASATAAGEAAALAGQKADQAGAAAAAAGGTPAGAAAMPA